MNAIPISRPVVSPVVKPLLRNRANPTPPTPVPPVTVAPELEKLVTDRITADGLMTSIKELAATPRVGGSPEYRKSAESIVQQMQDAGWAARIEEIKSGRGSVFNVVADREGSAPPAERKLVIAGAHLDSVPRGPGANDDASGSSALIATARALKDVSTPNDVRLVWFDREEQGLIGSGAYAREHKDELGRAVVMLNADMIGSQFGRVSYSVGATSPSAVGTTIKSVGDRNNIPSVFLDERHSRSDHHSFDRTGVPAAHFGVSVRTINKEDPHYHSPRDTPDKINQQILEGNSDLFALSLLHFANQPQRLAPQRFIKPPFVHTGPPI